MNLEVASLTLGIPSESSTLTEGTRYSLKCAIYFLNSTGKVNKLIVAKDVSRYALVVFFPDMFSSVKKGMHRPTERHITGRRADRKAVSNESIYI